MTEPINLTELRRGDTYLGPDGSVMLIPVATLAALLDLAEAARPIAVGFDLNFGPERDKQRFLEALARFHWDTPPA